MTYLHPWAIALGVAGAALPVVIHLLTRPRPVRMPMSTIRFLREAVQQRRARHRLRDAIVLLLRTAAVLLLGWVMARPFFGRAALIDPNVAGDAVRVVVLDVSHSMSASNRGIQVFERARPAAAKYLVEQAGLQANVILAGAAARPVFDRLSTNFAALREEVGRARPRSERLNAQAAVNRAAELLADANATGRREIVIISDFQRTNWAAVDFSPLPAETNIQLESAAPAEPLDNLAVLRVGTPGRAEKNREMSLEIEVGNFTSTARPIQIDVGLGDATYRLEGLCPAGNRHTLSADVSQRAAGWQTGEARLVGVQDALPADDVRPFVLDVRPAPTYVLLTRQSEDRRPSSSYYLERGLVPQAPHPGREEARVVRMDPARIDRDMLAAADVIAVDHAGRLPADVIKLLANQVRRGRGILYVASEPADAGNLKILADAAGTDLQLPVEFVPASAGEQRRDLFLTEVRGDQAPFGVFGDRVSAVTASLRFNGGLATRRREGALADDVLAAYGDRSACLVVSAFGAGTIAVLNADLAATNLSTSAAFVPFIGELLGRLLGRQRSADVWACGEPLAVYLPPAAGPVQGLSVFGPDAASEALGQLQEDSGGILWRSPGLSSPGVYEVKRDNTTQFALAAAVPQDESDLRSMDASVFQGRLAGGRSVQFRNSTGGDDENRDDVWVWLAVACVGCLLGEVLALKAFRT